MLRVSAGDEHGWVYMGPSTAASIYGVGAGCFGVTELLLRALHIAGRWPACGLQPLLADFGDARGGGDAA